MSASGTEDQRYDALVSHILSDVAIGSAPRSGVGWETIGINASVDNDRRKTAEAKRWRHADHRTFAPVSDGV